MSFRTLKFTATGEVVPLSENELRELPHGAFAALQDMTAKIRAAKARQ